MNPPQDKPAPEGRALRALRILLPAVVAVAATVVWEWWCGFTTFSLCAARTGGRVSDIGRRLGVLSQSL